MSCRRRRVEIAAISAVANGLWMSQIARNLTDSVDGLLPGERYRIHDRDQLFTDEFLRTLKDTGGRFGEVAGAEPESERRCGARREEHQGIPLAAADPVGGKFYAVSCSGLRSPLIASEAIRV
jgi:hypothetical protein